MTDPSSHDLDLLHKSLAPFAAKIEFPIAFAGIATPSGAPLSSFIGTHGQHIHGLFIEPTQGLGGLALAEHRPVTATQYRNATSITHRYDREVLAEGIVSLLAVPVIVDDTVRAVVYGGHRIVTQFGDTVIRSAMRMAQKLAWEYSVHDEVERRLAVLVTEGALDTARRRPPEERQELRVLYCELREVSREILDPAIIRRLEAIGRLLRERGAEPSDSPIALSPREMDVMAQVALGRRNAHIAKKLGLTESTVKSYLSAAMRKLDATSRYEAVIIARRIGLIP